MIIAITGGKGGTGKSTIATALAIELAKNHSVQLVDLDVDCPNDHLILGMDRQKKAEVTQMVPVLDESKCIKCGKCAEVCKSGAIVFVKNKFPIFFEEQCSGCTACEKICPMGAISRGKKITGNVFIGRNEKVNVDLISGEMLPTQMEGVRVVRAAKNLSTKKKYDFTIIDTAAGTHCPVLVALRNVDLVLAVTEPTPLGLHDLDLILKLVKTLNLPSEVIINKASIGDKKSVYDVLKKANVKVFGEVPYSKDFVLNYSKGIPIVHSSISEMARKLEGLL